MTTSGICGSDLHLYESLKPFMTPGDILGHEPMGEVVEVGSAIDSLRVGDRVVVPFNISCGQCWMCTEGLQSQCETTQVREFGSGAALFGYSKLYGQVPGGQAEFLRVPMAHYGPIPVPEHAPDDRYRLPVRCSTDGLAGGEYANIPAGGSVAVLGLGPIGDMCTRIAMHRGTQSVIGIDRVPERLERARRNGVTTLDLDSVDDMAGEVLEMTEGRGPDSVIDAVGMEAHGSPVARAVRAASSALPSGLGEPVMRKAGIDQLAALHAGIDLVRRGGTLSISGVYGGMADPMPMLTLFDKQVTLRMGQANVRRWIDDVLPLVEQENDPLGLETFATHHVTLASAPDAYESFASKSDGAIKILLKP